MDFGAGVRVLISFQIRTGFWRRPRVGAFVLLLHAMAMTSLCRGCVFCVVGTDFLVSFLVGCGSLFVKLGECGAQFLFGGSFRELLVSHCLV
jgi:hypothetical protein